MMRKPRVLFVCTHNSSRSQMAEGLLRPIFGDYYEVYSAGTEPRGVSPFAVGVMEEIGINISHHTSKGVDEFFSVNLDTVVTVCDSAQELCPYVPARNNIHQRFEDPRAATGSDQARIKAFRRVRDQIKAWIQEYFNPQDS